MFALSLDACSGRFVELGSSSAENLVALGSLEFVSRLASNSLALVFTANFNQLEVLWASVTNAGSVDHLEALFAFLDALSVDSLESSWAGSVDASMELLGVLLVVSAFELVAGLGGSVESPSFWARNSFAFLSNLVEVLWAVDLIAKSIFNLEIESFVA